MTSLATSAVIEGFHPDPAVGPDDHGVHWLANSSFEYSPGVPLFRSDDLIHWQQVGNVLTADTQLPAGDAAPSRGIFAPTLRHHDGRFWLITTDVGRPGQLVTADDPPAGWTEPVRIAGLPGIDPDLAWDDDGAGHVTYCSGDPDRPGIAQARTDPATGVVLEPPRALWSGTGLQYPEAPHLYRHDGCFGE
ncbi:family 43 glycosylhydrolase [Actinoplanes sp. NPDC051411]|uniref:family 43 glycosylhydrolase n=1 Tax=Actinoplanes sp. NPDC051411 TaxID=3155522 RepID=UPI0034469A2A